MGFVVAAVGTIAVWAPRVNQQDSPLWPTLMATVGFWILGGMLTWLKRR